MDYEFPKFARVDLDHRQVIESYTHKFKPYSDFNFYSQWCWDTSDKRSFSILNDNLVLLLTDYTTEDPVLTFLGTNQVAETARLLLAHAKTQRTTPALRYVPAITVEKIDDPDLSIEAERGDFDYIFSLTELYDLKGNRFKSKRRLRRAFTDKYPQAEFHQIDISDDSSASIVLRVIEDWQTRKEADQKDYDLEHELVAINKLMTLDAADKITLSYVTLDETPIGFSIDEALPQGYLLSHFSKTNTSYLGVGDYLNTEIAGHFLNQGYQHWNWEQDLGEKGLREAKMHYHPVSFLKKYQISISN